ncbi:FAD binding domain containing protein [Acanthamoeba castellanii str. Neff]|uniref:FAD binding domain containing protein n=1 Tax=Acanthamoeba castellanii (strain ATCC 30010 / Neff) TaxID=1257118 RepID=L8HH93_ACACF|nr:FAD binding domain containing protein [Acanthamoeba castellanii str. Neff]ELR24567.1 FAD binding domain containing protein [Acanthamoeba castellanii str. Neff]
MTTDRPHDQLAASLVRGQLLYPEDPGYDRALSTWNLQATKRPEAVVSARGPGDIIATIKYAKAKGLEMTVKAGGHSMSSLCTGLVIDFSHMKGIRVDVENKTVRVEPGCLLRDLDAELSVHGLVVPGGVVSHTGVAGLALGGGWGYLGRCMGLTCDNILSVDIVTADGQLRTASKTANQDLFWAVRGAGPSFGVVTSFKFRCHPLPGPVYCGVMMYPWSRSPEVAQQWMNVVTSPDGFPDNLTLYLLNDTQPTGEKGATVFAVFNGPAEQGKQLLKPFIDLGPVATQEQELPFRLVQQGINDRFPPGRHYYQTGTFVKVSHPMEPLDVRD